MLEPTLYFTANTLYAVKQVHGTKEYWKVPWEVSEFEEVMRDVSSTLNSRIFNVAIAQNAPSLTSTSLDLISGYSQAFANHGYQIASIRTVDPSIGLDGLDMENQDSSLRVGSLEDLTSQSSKTINLWPVVKIILIALTAIILGMGIWFFFLSPKNSTTQPITESPETVLPSPSPSKPPVELVPSPANEDFKLSIENGSGIVGIAGKLSALLEAKGFVVGDVGNADSYNYTHAVLKTKPSVPASVSKTIMDLLIDSAWETEELSASSSYDAVIIIGKQSSLSN